MVAKRTRKARRALLAALCATAVLAPAANAADARYEGASSSGGVAFFSTVDKLVPGDTDLRRDVYARAFDEGLGGYVTRQVSLGPAGGNNAFDAQYLTADESGQRVFFTTAERLTEADTDTTVDVYVRDLVANTTALVSAGDPSCQASGCGNADTPVGALPRGVLADGDRIAFTSTERLASADQDSVADVYVRDLEAGTTTLVSVGDGSCPGPDCGNGAQPASFEGASSGGDRVFFTTQEALEGADADTLSDIYVRDIGSESTSLVSTPGACPPETDCTPVFAATSDSGVHAYFETNERISGLDTDDSQDVYDWSAGTATLASRGPTGGNGAHNALYAGSAPDGGAAFFETSEALVAADTDTGQDVYRRGSGATELVSAPAAGCEAPGCNGGDLDASVVRRNGVPSGVYDEGAKAFFFSAEKLAAEDGDTAFDVYVRDLDAGTTTLVSQADPSCSESTCGNGPSNANLAGASLDGSHALLVTDEALVDADQDLYKDVYDRSGGATSLVSTGPINGNGPQAAQLQGLSADGLRAFFVTRERLTGEDDLLSEEDVYQRSPSGTILVSRGNDTELESIVAPPTPLLEATDPPSPGASTEPRAIGTEPDESALIKIYASADCSGEPIATGSAAELAAPGIAVGVAAGSTTSMRATAEAQGFASECSEPLVYQQQDPEPPPPPPPPPPPSSPQPPAGGGSVQPGLPLLPIGVSGSGNPRRSESAPRTRITFGPLRRTRRPRPVFRFRDATEQEGTRFRCRLDRKKWRRCRSPFRLKRLRGGKHVFRVRGIGASGQRERRPSVRRFRLVRRSRR